VSVLVATVSENVDVSGRLEKPVGRVLAYVRVSARDYLLAMTVVMALSGWALDRYGGRTTWTVCIVLFLAGSMLCGTAWSAQSLIAFRVIQGLGGG
jgi:hypothetical protein